MTSINKYIHLLTQQKDKLNVITEVLSVFEYEDLILFKSKTPRLFQGLLKVPFLRRKHFSELLKNGRVLRDDTVDIYGAISFILLQNVDLLNHYIELRDKLDMATAVKQYDDAYRLMDQIETDISVSMTIAYYRLKLTRLDKGISASTQLYNSLCKENSLLSYITHIAFKSASVDIPFEQEIEQYYKNLKAGNDIKGLFIAFAFPYKDIGSERWMRLLTATSIIDLYEGFILQLSKLESKRLKEEHVKGLIDTLAKEIHDVRLERYYSLLNNGISCSNEHDDIEAKCLIEKYYKGDYDDVIVHAKEYLHKSPLQSTVIDLYNRSCIKNDNIQEDLFPEDSLANRLYNLSLMASANEDLSEICLTQLRNVCIAWYTIPCMRHIYSIFSNIENKRVGNIYDRFWAYSYVPELRDAGFYEDTKQVVDYLKASGYSDEESAQIRIVDKRIDDMYNQTYRLLKGIDRSDVEYLQKGIAQDEIAPLLTNNIVSQLFNILTAESHYDEAISLYVNYKLKKPFAKVFFDKPRLFQDLTDERDNCIANQQELAAFYTMVNADIYKRYLAYKRYLKQRGVNKASALDNEEGELYRYFIGKVADKSVLILHVRAFDTDDEVNSERIDLCRKAFELTKDKAYSDEITSLIKEQEINTLAKQVNDSKIHVDVQSLVAGELDAEKLMFEAYIEVDDNIEIFEQKNIEWLLDYIQTQNKGGKGIYMYELPSIKYKMMMFRQMILSIRDKFLFDPKYGLDKYLSARIRHGTLITQLRNHFLSHGLVTNKIESGEYVRESIWTQRKGTKLSETVKGQLNNRLLEFTQWLDEQLRIIKEEKIQIKTERNDDKKDGLFDYSDDLMAEMIDNIGGKSFETFDAFVHTAMELLWKWTNETLSRVRDFLEDYRVMVLNEMDKLQNDIIMILASNSHLSNDFRTSITTCRTEFQTDILTVSSWFKPEQSRVRYFTVQQAVDTSLSVINRINQNALSFHNITITDDINYSGYYFNAIHDIFHDMMSNILKYETRRPHLKGKGEIHISRTGDLMSIIVSNPVDATDIEEIKTILLEQHNFPALIAGGKTRRDKNSGCVKIYSTVMYTLGGESRYENLLNNNCFIAKLQIDTKNLIYHDDSIS